LNSPASLRGSRDARHQAARIDAPEPCISGGLRGAFELLPAMPACLLKGPDLGIPRWLRARSKLSAGRASWIRGQNANRCARFVSVDAGFPGLFQSNQLKEPKPAARQNGWLALISKGFSRERLVLPDRIELSTSPLPMECSTTELRQHCPDMRIGPKDTQGGSILATRPPFAQAREGPAKRQKGPVSGSRSPLSPGSISGRSGSRLLAELTRRPDWHDVLRFGLFVSAAAPAFIPPCGALIGLLLWRCRFEEWSEQVHDDG
jgi:hypothetical protein